MGLWFTSANGQTILDSFHTEMKATFEVEYSYNTPGDNDNKKKNAFLVVLIVFNTVLFWGKFIDIPSVSTLMFLLI